MLIWGSAHSIILCLLSGIPVSTIKLTPISLASVTVRTGGSGPSAPAVRRLSGVWSSPLLKAGGSPRLGEVGRYSVGERRKRHEAKDPGPGLSAFGSA